MNRKFLEKRRPVTPERRAEALAARQYGVITRVQALGCGMTRGMVDERLRLSRWRSFRNGIYLLPGTEDHWLRTVMATQLHWGDGAVLSHMAAGAIWEGAGFVKKDIELWVPRKRHRIQGDETVHRYRSLERVDMTERHRIRVTTPARTLIDLATVLALDRLEVVVDDFFYRLVDPRRVLRRIEATRTRGVGELRMLLSERVGGRPSESPLETITWRFLIDSGFHGVVRQHEIYHEGELLARVDFAFVRERVAIEADGRAHAQTPLRARDRARDLALRALGWTVLRFGYSDVTRRQDECVAAIRAATQQRSAHA